MSDRALRKVLVKLAFDHPELRPDLLPLIRGGDGEVREARQMTPTSLTQGLNEIQGMLDKAQMAAGRSNLEGADQALTSAFRKLKTVRTSLERATWGGYRP